MQNLHEKHEKSNGRGRYSPSDKHAVAPNIASGEPPTRRGALVDTSAVAVCAGAILDPQLLSEIRGNVESSWEDIASLSEALECTANGLELLDEGRGAVANLLSKTRWVLEWLSGIERAVDEAKRCAEYNGLPVPAVAVLRAPWSEAGAAVGANGIHKVLGAALVAEIAPVSQ